MKEPAVTNEIKEHDILHERAKRAVKRNPASVTGQQSIRFWVQLAFLALCVWIGVEFAFFFKWHESGTGFAVPRPPGVEGFLPISALMGLRYWLLTGSLHLVHPAATVILLAIVTISFVFKKSFCSWFCPIGTISESLADFGKKLLKRNVRVWKWLDIPLRSLKYLLLAFFVYAVFFTLDLSALGAFLDSPYNRVADVKMLLFFRDISRFSLIVIAALVFGSVLIRNFWCRYLCPYGALLGLVGLLSPFRITRNAATCTDCAKCTKVCPASIPVHRRARVLSDECTSCMLCVTACPVADTLHLRSRAASRFVILPKHLAIIIVAIFMLLTGAAMVTGRWRSSITDEEYSHRIKTINDPVYQHHYGRAPEETGSPEGNFGGGVDPTHPAHGAQ